MIVGVIQLSVSAVDGLNNCTEFVHKHKCRHKIARLL